MWKLHRKTVFRQNFRGGVTQKVDLLLTDPPYGVDYVGKTGDAMTIENDGVDRDALLKLLTGSFDAVSEWLREGAAYYIWCASKTWDVFAQAVEQLGWPVREQLIWNKDCFVMGRQDYQWKHEPCLYRLEAGRRAQVVQRPQPNDRDRLSSTQGEPRPPDHETDSAV